MVPQLKWKLRVCGAQAADEMIFECLNCPFGSIDSMIVWFYELDVALL
jgi:hypothetical protein